MFTKKYNTLFFMLLGLALFAQSCKKNENVITRIPDITISPVSVSEKMIGDAIEIDPEVNYGGQNATFNYKWFRYVVASNRTVLKQISTDKRLQYTADSLGNMTLRLEATNTATKIMAAITFSFNVVSRSERGWYVLKANAQGNTDMDAFLSTAKGDVINRDIIQTITGNAMAGSPVGLGFTSSYNWLNPLTNSFVGFNSCLMPVSAKEIMAYRIRDERILASTNPLFFEVPASASRNFEGLITDPGLIALVNNGQVNTMNIGSNAFLPPRLGDYTLSAHFTTAPYISGTLSYILGFDQKSESFVGIKYRQTDVTYFPDVYMPENGGVITTRISANRMNAKLVFMENTDGTLDTIRTSNGRAYGLLRRNGGNNMALVGLNLQEIQPISGRNLTHSPIRSLVELPSANYPELTSASTYALNKNNPILYFANANKIGTYSIDNGAYSTSIYTFGVGEEITYMKFLDQQYDTPSSNTFRNLVVGTHSSGKYKIYRFVVLGNTLSPVGTIMEGTGKVKTLLYASPNTANFFNAMYRYK